jgi:hypothetical protein
MKHIPLLLTITLFGCEAKDRHCDYQFENNSIGFMMKGGILDKYDNGRVFYSIVDIVNPKDWDYNLYFTGSGFSENEDDAIWIIEKDSCKLKSKYVEYLNNKQ